MLDAQLRKASEVSECSEFSEASDFTLQNLPTMTRTILLTMLALLALTCWAQRPLLVGHRGCALGVENTAAAFRLGVDYYHYDGLECDVRVTKDGHYVISHDETTERVGGRLTVADATLAELQAETYTQTRYGATYTGSICTVAEYLDICIEKGVFPVIELKWSAGINNNDMSNFPGLAALIEAKGLTDRTIILTSMKKSQEYVRQHYPTLQCQWLCNANWQGNEAWCRQWGLNPSISVGNFDEQTVKAFAALGLYVACWTADDPARCRELARMGVKYITTNKAKFQPHDWEN